LLLFGSGLLGVGLEAVGVQVLAQVFENTIYTFADVLAVYLVGTATGAWLYARRAERAIAGRPAMIAAGLLVVLAVTTIGAALAASRATGVLESIAPTGASWTAHMIAEAVVAALVFGPATLAMGALFAHAMALVAARGVGRAYAINTLGCALAPFVFGLWAVERFGYRDGLFAVVWGYLLLFGAFTWLRRFRPVHQLGAIIGVLALTAAAPASLVLVEPDDGWTVLARHETPMGLVIVSEQPKEQARKGGEPLRRLQVGRHFRMGGALAFGERRMGQLPLLLQPSAERALYLGIGTGGTLGAVTSAPLVHVDAVELVPAVLGEIARFAAINGNVHEDSRVTLRAADARRFVAASDASWDVVVADLFHPAIDGAGGLYAREHFAAIAERLAPGGTFTQWLPLYQLDAATLATIVRTFCDVFPETHAWLGIYNAQTPAIALIGRAGGAPLRIDLDALVERLGAPVFGELLMQDPRDLLGAYVADRDALLAFAGEGPRNTDLEPWVLLHAPRLAYEGGKTAGADNLRALFSIWREIPPELVVGDAQRREAMLAGASAFSQALRAYLEGEILRVGASKDAPPSAQELDRYLAAYALAPEFVPARGMLYQIALAWPNLADSIFERMSEVTPNEPRVWKAWLESARRSGDRARFEEIRSRAQPHLSEG
jgi:spermidine synthase